jgi:hypothetical protein
VWGTSGDDDTTWSSSGEDQAMFPEDEASEPLPDPALEFGDEDVPPAPSGDVTSVGGGV